MQRSHVSRMSVSVSIWTLVRGRFGGAALRLVFGHHLKLCNVVSFNITSRATSAPVRFTALAFCFSNIVGPSLNQSHWPPSVKGPRGPERTPTKQPASDANYCRTGSIFCEPSAMYSS